MMMPLVDGNQQGHQSTLAIDSITVAFASHLQRARNEEYSIVSVTLVSTSPPQLLRRMYS